MIGYSLATTTLLGMALVSCGIEYVWIEVVFKRFPVLRLDRDSYSKDRDSAESEGRRGSQSWKAWLRQEKADWTDFTRLPIFCSEWRMPNDEDSLNNDRLDSDRSNISDDPLIWCAYPLFKRRVNLYTD